MTSIDGALLDFKRLDLLATGDTAIHRLDPRAKVLVTLVFIVTVISFGKYEVTALAPFLIFPVVMVACGNLPASYIIKKIVMLCPFAVIVGMFNPIFDRQVLVQIGPLAVTGGWLSFASIILRSILTVGAAIVLVAVTGFTAVCRALARLGMPQAFAMQLLLLYRYIFVLTDEVARVERARKLRSFGKKMEPRIFGPLVGHLLLRTWQRAERIHMGMLARGFAGEFHTRKDTDFGGREVLFVFGWTTLVIFLRFQNLSKLVGSLVIGILP
ncbi:MAG TPA: cobalt ECF transporter T component CbiQ [Geobacteraceae bacterium]